MEFDRVVWMLFTLFSSSDRIRLSVISKTPTVVIIPLTEFEQNVYIFCMNSCHAR